MKYRVKKTGEYVELDKSNFKAKGGEGSIHIIGDTVYKLCDDGKMIPEGKFAELNALKHHRIIKPEDIILKDNKPVGYTMQLVPNNPITLSQMLTKTYRIREGVTPKIMSELVLQIYDGIKNGIHAHKGYLQVDGNQLNYMVSNGHREVYFIDVNSFQTPSYPVDTIMPNICDWSCGSNFSQLTDWYSFSIIAWQMFIGIHPFMHTHPRFPNRKTAMIDQMKANCSILDKKSDYPINAIYYPFEDYVPGGKNGAYMQWFQAIFLDGKRLAPPDGFQGTLGVVATKFTKIVGSNNFEFTEIKSYVNAIIDFCSANGRQIIVTTENIYVDNQFKQTVPKNKICIGFTNKNFVPLSAQLEKGILTIYNYDTESFLVNGDKKFEMNAKDIMACDGRFYVHYDQNIYEIIFTEKSAAIMPLAKNVASVLPHATKLFNGVAIQDMMGKMIASIFPETGHHRQVPLNEISSDMKIIEAKYERNVLMVVTLNKVTGKYDRLVYIFKNGFSGYHIRKIEDITPIGINFTVLERGLVVSITEEEKVEIFKNDANDTNIKEIEDPSVNSNMRLHNNKIQVLLTNEEKLYGFSLKKKP